MGLGVERLAYVSLVLGALVDVVLSLVGELGVPDQVLCAV